MMGIGYCDPQGVSPKFSVIEITNGWLVTVRNQSAFDAAPHGFDVSAVARDYVEAFKKAGVDLPTREKWKDEHEGEHGDEEDQVVGGVSEETAAAAKPKAPFEIFAFLDQAKLLEFLASLVKSST